MKNDLVSRYLYALEKLAARDSFVDFLDNWEINEDEYREIKKFLNEQGISGYIS
jgi:hypothetical protein